MSRHDDGDYDGDYPDLDLGRWDWNLGRAISGKRGQRILRELREALLAMPNHRLIDGELATPDGDVCAVGALVAYKRAKATGGEFSEAVDALAAQGRYRDGDGGLSYTFEAGKTAGLVETLAWEISYLNDETWQGLTPEQRWEKCLAWVESKIVSEPSE